MFEEVEGGHLCLLPLAGLFGGLFPARLVLVEHGEGIGANFIDVEEVLSPLFHQLGVRIDEFVQLAHVFFSLACPKIVVSLLQILVLCPLLVN